MNLPININGLLTARTVEWERVEFKIRWKDICEFPFLSRRYRNRRVDEFLKELEMTEGRGTGIPKILREIKKNGSPEPIFHTDKDRAFFLVEFPVHPVFAEVPKQKEVTTEVNRLLNVITGDHSRKELQEMLKLKNGEHFRKSACALHRVRDHARALPLEAPQSFKRLLLAIDALPSGLAQAKRDAGQIQTFMRVFKFQARSGKIPCMSLSLVT
jgi:hypothetical protein